MLHFQLQSYACIRLSGTSKNLTEFAAAGPYLLLTLYTDKIYRSVTISKFIAFQEVMLYLVMGVYM